MKVNRNVMLGAFVALLALVSNDKLEAQSLCDSLQIEELHINPLASDYLAVQLSNNSSELFTYPGIRVYFNDELVGEEEVNLFGIAQWSAHGIPHTMVDIVPGQEYNLTLELWTGFYTDMICSFDENVVLIPTDECHVVTLWAAQDTDKQIMDPIIMELTDEDGNVVYSEGHQFSPDNPYYTDEICLEYGCYTATFTTSDAVITAAINFSFQTTEVGGWIEVQAVPGDAFVTLPVNMWSDCGPTSVEGIDENDLQLVVYPNPSSSIVNLMEPTSGSVIDTFGKVVVELSGVSEFDVRSLAAGTYFIHTDQGRVSRFIVE